MTTDDLTPHDSDERPSKSQIKRDMHALQALGKVVVELSSDRVKQLPLSEKLRDAVLLAQRTTSREGRRRQIHYVGKLMRDAPALEIQQKIDEWANGSRQQTARLHAIERDRDRLIANDAALTTWLDDHPGVNVQAFRSLIRAARSEHKKNQGLLPGQQPQRKHYRALYQAIKDASVASDTTADQPMNPSNQDDDS
jgi:ribosome-associated protein